MLFFKSCFLTERGNRLYLGTKLTQRRAENQLIHPIKSAESGIELGNYRWGASATTVVPPALKFAARQ